MNLKTKKILAIILIIVIIMVLSLCLYLYYNKGNNNESSVDNAQDSDNKISVIYEVNLSDQNQAFELKEKNVSLKFVNKQLYVNDNIVSDVKIDHTYITDQVIIFTYNAKCNQVISYVIDENGKSVPFTKNNYQVYDFRMLEGDFVVAGSDTCPCKKEDNCTEIIAIKIKYNGKELIIK